VVSVIRPEPLFFIVMATIIPQVILHQESCDVHKAPSSVNAGISNMFGSLTPCFNFDISYVISFATPDIPAAIMNDFNHSCGVGPVNIVAA